MAYVVRGGVHSGEVIAEEDLDEVRRRGIEASGGHLRIAESGDAEEFEKEYEENTELEAEKAKAEEQKAAWERVTAPGAPPHAQVDESEVDKAREEGREEQGPADPDLVEKIPTGETLKEPVDKDEFSREELNELAGDHGIEGAASLPNKAAVVEAINEVRTREATEPAGQ